MVIEGMGGDDTGRAGGVIVGGRAIHWRSELQIKGVAVTTGKSAGPLAPGFKRLIDASRHLDEALQGYSEPAELRKAVNAAVQALRNSVHLLLSHKAAIPGFQPWYDAWLPWLKSIPALKWLIDARNTIVHHSDLDLQSSTKVHVITSYHRDERLDRLAVEDESRSSLDIARLIKAEVQLVLGLPAEGVVQLERTWRLPDLDNRELLSVLGYCLHLLLALFRDCYKRLVSVEPGAPTSSICTVQSSLASMSPNDFALPSQLRTLSVDLETDQPMWIRKRSGKPAVSPEEAVDRYGSPAAAPGSTVSLHDRGHYLMSQARMIMRVDGFHHPMVFLFRQGAPLTFQGLHIETHSQKYLLWDQVAQEVRRLGADEVFSVAEAWVAPVDKSNPHLRPEASVERREYLTVTGISKQGDFVQLAAPIGRVSSWPILGPVEDLDGPIPNYFAPIKHVWSSYSPSCRTTNG